MEEILIADPGQLQAEDSMYGGTPLHWAKTAEVKYKRSCLVRNSSDQTEHIFSPFGACEKHNPNTNVLHRANDRSLTGSPKNPHNCYKMVLCV